MTELAGGAALDKGFEFDHVILAVNPKATNARMAHDVETDLREGDLGVPIEVIHTVEGGVEANQELFGKKLHEGVLVVGVVGDGGFRDIGSAFLLPDHEQLSRLGGAALTTVGGGYACDMRWSLHGKHDPTVAPTELIKNGVAQPFRPLTWEMVPGDESPPVDTFAFSYIGHGKTGIGAEMVNTDAYRARARILREPHLGASVLSDSSYFHVVWLDGPAEGTAEDLGDLTIAAGPRMAKYFHTQSRHWDPLQRSDVIRTRRGTHHTLINMARLAAGATVGTLTDEPARFKTVHDTKVHMDGERPLHVPFSSEIAVGRHDQPVWLLYSPDMLPPELRPKH